MRVSNITSNSFSGVNQVVSKMSDGSTLTKFVSQKGKDLGFHMVKPNGDISGARQFSDGIQISYETTHLPAFNTDSYATLRIKSNKPQKTNGLLMGKYYLNTDYFKAHKELRTEKGALAYLKSLQNLKEKARMFTKNEDVIL